MSKRIKTKLTLLLIISCMLGSGSLLNAQILKVNPKSFTMSILGTTNVHDFETKVTQASGEVVLNGEKELQSLVLEIPVKSIKSGERLMDTKTYEAFNAEKNPNITFKLVDVNSLQINGNDVNVNLTGNLTMAGVTRKISFKSAGKNIKNGVYEFKGSVNLKMTDFSMKPPTAMMGMMKVGDAITLKYSATFEGNQLTQN